MDLREKITNELAEYLYTGVREFHGVENGNFPLARKILALPFLYNTIDKAEKYDKLFENLIVVEDCKNKGCDGGILWQQLRPNGGMVKTVCFVCNGTGKISRPLTEEEKEEFVNEILPNLIIKNAVFSDTRLFFKSGGTVEVKK